MLQDFKASRVPFPVFRRPFLATSALANSYSSFRTLPSYHLSREGFFASLGNHNDGATMVWAGVTVNWVVGPTGSSSPIGPSFEGKGPGTKEISGALY